MASSSAPMPTGRGNVPTPFPKKNPDVGPDTRDWLKRKEVAERLGVSLQTVKNYEQRGLLHPVHEQRVDSKNRDRIIVLHDPNEVAYLRDKSTKEKGPTADTSNWLTRNEATDYLSVSAQTLRNYEARGVLKPVRAVHTDARKHERTMVLYNPEELKKVPRGQEKVFLPKLAGELNARANEMFDEGRSIREVVTALRQTSDTVRDWHERWFNDGGHEIVVSPVAKQCLEQLVGSFKDVTELVERISAKLKAS